MRHYSYSVTWRDKGKGFERTEHGAVTASTIRTAAGKVLSVEAKHGRKNWKEPEEAVFILRITVGPATNGRRET